VVCSVNDKFLINCPCTLIVKTREVDTDIVGNFERPDFVTCVTTMNTWCVRLMIHFSLIVLVH
jgi:hypothetical protein